MPNQSFLAGDATPLHVTISMPLDTITLIGTVEPMGNTVGLGVGIGAGRAVGVGTAVADWPGVGIGVATAVVIGVGAVATGVVNDGVGVVSGATAWFELTQPVPPPFTDALLVSYQIPPSTQRGPPMMSTTQPSWGTVS